MHRVAEGRLESVGKRLDSFKARSGVAPNGSISWHLVGAYKLRFAESGRCQEVLHMASKHTATVPEHVLIMRDFELLYNWCDETAQVVKPPLAPLVLASLFDKAGAKGPWSLQQFGSGKNKDFDSYVNECYESWSADRLRAQAPEQSKETEAAFKEMAKETAQENLKRARVAAKVAMTNKKQRQVRRLNST